MRRLAPDVRRALTLAVVLLLLPACAARAADASLELVRTTTTTDARGTVVADVFRLVVVAAPGEANQLEVAPRDGGGVTVRDAGAPLRPGAGCLAAPDGVACTPPRRPGAAALLVGSAIVLGDRDDLLILRSPAFSLVVPPDLVSAGPGGDTIRVIGPESHAQVAGGPGPDHLVAEDGAQLKATYAERAAPVRVTLDGAPDDGEAGEGDLLAPTVSAVVGGAGDDVLDAGAATAVRLPALRGGVLLAGGPGADVLLGSARDDRLEGGDGPDDLQGAAGDDELDGGAGADLLRGGDGADLADYAARTATVRVQPGTGADDGEALEGDDAGADVERVRGGAGADDLRGGPGDQELDGGPGDDRLSGGPGDDRLIARDGTDLADGGPGRDLVFLVPETRLALRDGVSDGLACLGPLRAPAQLDDSDRLSRGCRPHLRLVSPALRPEPRGVARAVVRCPRARLACRATLRLRAEEGRGATLAIARDVMVRADGRRRPVALRLTPAGRRAASRGRGARAAQLTIRSFGHTFATERTVRLLRAR